MDETAGAERPRPTRIDRELNGDPIQVGGRIIRPVAHLGGWRMSYDQAGASAGGAWVRLTPTVVVVQEGDGSEEEVAIVNGTAAALQGMRAAALAIGAAGLVLTTLFRIIRFVRSRG